MVAYLFNQLLPNKMAPQPRVLNWYGRSYVQATIYRSSVRIEYSHAGFAVWTCAVASAEKHRSCCRRAAELNKDIMREIQREPDDSRSAAATVYVVDADQSVQHGVQALLGTLGVGVLCYGSAEQFLENADLDKPGCVITEVHLPGISGLDLQEVLRERGVDYPVIVMSSDADVPTAVRAMALGALDFVEKPFVDRVLIARVKQLIRSVD